MTVPGRCPSPVGAPPIIDVARILSSIAAATDVIRQLEIPCGAPPAFLLDARRHGFAGTVTQGRFDNRSLIQATDFPSAEFLKGQGIREVVLISQETAPKWDVAAVLRDWQNGSMKISSQVFDRLWNPQPLALGKPSWLARAWFWFQSEFMFEEFSPGIYGRIRSGGG